MIKITSSDFAKNFGRYRDMTQREIVAVTSYNRITGYFIPKYAYDEYMKLKALMGKSYAVTELPKDVIRAIGESKMDPRHAYLDSLLDEDAPHK